MAETLRKGDRVRVTYEGVVSYVDMLQRFVNVDDHDTLRVANAKVEVLKRHAFPDGTLWVGTSGDSLYKAGKRWVWDSGAPASADDDTVRQYIADGDGKVVYEPPTA